MNVDIQITAEDLVRAAVKRYVLKPADPEMLLAETIRDLFPSTNGEVVRNKALENSVLRGIEKTDRERHANESAFLLVGQMSLFGDLIPEHKIPEQLLSKSVRETQEWMETRARIEQENAEELRRAAAAQERKAEQFRRWLAAVNSVYQAILEAGLNPETLTYAQAIQQAETLQSGCVGHSGNTAKRPLR
jgi:hypothetical protein